MHYLINPRQVKNFEILTFHPSLMSLPQACSSIISASRKSSETNTPKMVIILSPLQIKNKQAVSNGIQAQLTNASLGMREYVSPPVHPFPCYSLPLNHYVWKPLARENQNSTSRIELMFVSLREMVLSIEYPLPYLSRSYYGSNNIAERRIVRS